MIMIWYGRSTIDARFAAARCMGGRERASARGCRALPTSLSWRMSARERGARRVEPLAAFKQLVDGHPRQLRLASVSAGYGQLTLTSRPLQDEPLSRADFVRIVTDHCGTAPVGNDSDKSALEISPRQCEAADCA